MSFILYSPIVQTPTHREASYMGIVFPASGIGYDTLLSMTLILLDIVDKARWASWQYGPYTLLPALL